MTAPVAAVVVATLSHPAGRAVRADYSVTEDVVRVRILRRAGVAVSASDDVDAVVILDGWPAVAARVSADTYAIVDIGNDLVNGTAYHYAIYVYNVLDEEGDAATFVVTPALALAWDELNVKRLIMDRLELALADMRSQYTFRAGAGAFKVYGHYPLIDDVKFPCVSVHLDSDADARQFIGRFVGAPTRQNAARRTVHKGNVASVRMAVLGWSQDPDERTELMRLLKAAIKANLEVWQMAGYEDLTATFADAEDFQAYETPMYYAVCDLTGEVLGELVETITTKVETVSVPGAVADVQVLEHAEA